MRNIKLLLTLGIVTILFAAYVINTHYLSEKPSLRLPDNPTGKHPASVNKNYASLPAISHERANSESKEIQTISETSAFPAQMSKKTASLSEENASRTPTITIEDNHYDGIINTVGIDSTLVSNGNMFSANFKHIQTLNKGDKVELNIYGSTRQGTIEKKTISSLLGNSYTKIALGQLGEYMNIYSGSKISRGKIYTSEGSYIFEHKGNKGFIMSIYEYKKLNNALRID